MVDKNDEYEFADLENLSPDSMGDDDLLSAAPITPRLEQKDASSNIKRNALVVVILAVLAMLLYKFAGPFFTKKTSSTNTGIVVPPVSSQPTLPIVEQTPIIITPPTTVAELPKTSETADPQLSQKISALDLNQQTIRSDLNNANTQLSGINNNINNLNTKMANLAQLVNTMSMKMEQQSQQITMLIAAREKPKPRPIVKRAVAPSMVYFIQAVIPGRAWLISTNGSTLTVREGTSVPGYGIIKLIDPNQGRVLTSSGRIIRFSPQDS